MKLETLIDGSPIDTKIQRPLMGAQYLLPSERRMNTMSSYAKNIAMTTAALIVLGLSGEQLVKQFSPNHANQSTKATLKPAINEKFPTYFKTSDGSYSANDSYGVCMEFRGNQFQLRRQAAFGPVDVMMQKANPLLFGKVDNQYLQEAFAYANHPNLAATNTEGKKRSPNLKTLEWNPLSNRFSFHQKADMGVLRYGGQVNLPYHAPKGCAQQ